MGIRVLAPLLLMCAATSAAPFPDLSGTWEIDLEASDSMDEVLRALDRSWAERQIAKRLEVVNHIAQTEDRVTIRVEAPFVKHVEVLPLDGRFVTTSNQFADQVEQRSFWSRDRKRLITESRFSLPDGAPATLFVIRELDDGAATMIQTTRVVSAGGEAYTAHRIWRRSRSTP